MHGSGTAGKALERDDDTDHGPMTPRGMAAPPAATALRNDADASRPATIRIESYRGPASVQAARPSTASDSTMAPPAARARSGARLEGLMISQGLLINAFVLLMVFGWSAPLPGRRALLATFALGGIALAVLMHVTLAQVRRASPADGRPQPARGLGAAVRWRGRVVRVLPAALVTAWLGLGIYALALPPVANAFQESRPAATRASRASSLPAQVRPEARPVQSAPAGDVAPATPQRRLPYRP